MHQALRQAIEIEKTIPTLEKNLRRVLVDNVNMAYGLTGDSTRARDILNYGVPKNPGCPLFCHNLACTSAGKGALSEPKTHLTLAF